MIKTFTRIFLMVGLAAPINVAAGPYYNLEMHTSSATQKVSGAVKVAASSSSPNVPIFDLDGAAKLFTLNGASVALTNGGSVTGVNLLQFNTTDFGKVTCTEGEMWWNADDQTANLCLYGGLVTLQVGQEMLFKAKMLGSAGLNGQVVAITGASGNRPEIELADADNPALNHSIIGVLTEGAGENQPAIFTAFGNVRNVNSDHLVEGEKFYVSTTPGGTTATIPAYPARVIQLGLCIRKSATVGTLFISVLDTPDDIRVSSVTAAAFYGPLTGDVVGAASLNVLKTGDTMTGNLTLQGNGLELGFYNGDSQVRMGHDSGSLLMLHNLDIDYYVPGIGYDLNISTIGTMTVGGQEKTHRLRVDGGVLATSSITANEGFYGDLTGNVTGNLTGLASLNLPLTGGTLTGPLTLAGSSLTVNGAFAVQGSTFVVTGGKVGVGITPLFPFTGYATSAIPAQFYGYSKVAGAGSAGHGAIALGSNAAYYGLFDYNSSGNTNLTIANSYDSAAAKMSFVMREAGTDVEALSILGSGSVGIGTAIPASKVHVSSGIYRADGTLGALDGYVPAFYANTVNNTTSLILNPQSLNVGGLQVVNSNNASGARTSLINAGGEGIVLRSGFVGVGTISPTAKLHMSSGTFLADGLAAMVQVTKGAGSAVNGYALRVSSSTGEHIFGVHNDGHISVGGYAATLGTCTNGTLAANSHDMAGAIEFSGANTSCAVVFGNARDAEPFCVVSLRTGTPGPLPVLTAETVNGFTIAPNTGGFAAGDRINWWCPEAHE